MKSFIFGHFGAEESWYFSRVNVVSVSGRVLGDYSSETQVQLQLSSGKLKTGWLWAAAV